MNEIDTRDEIQQFFTSYTGAFERFDAVALATHFIYPSQIVADSQPPSVTTLASAEEYVAIITRFLALYRKAGVAGGKINKLSLTALSPRVVSAHLDWRVNAASGAALYEFQSVYTLAKGESGWRITAIVHNELPQLQAILSARKLSA